MCKKTVILGLGNILLKDEGIGVHIAQEMEKRNLPENVEVIDGGTASLYVFSKMKNIDKLIIIDAVKGKDKPGTVYRLHSQDLPGQNNSSFLSLHQINIPNVLTMAEKMGNVPKETMIIGIEPKEIDWGLELSSDIKQKIPEIIDIVLGEIKMRACDTRIDTNSPCFNRAHTDKHE